MEHKDKVRSSDNAVEWYWPQWAADASLPEFLVRDTESSHGRYATGTKTIIVKDLVKFHGHACDGLFRGASALAVGLSRLFPDGIIDRTDLRVLSRNSPCLGDVAAYLTGGRVRFNTQDVQSQPGVWFVLQKISSKDTVRVEEVPGVYPIALSDEEGRLILTKDATPEQLDRLQTAQWEWVREVLLKTPRETLYKAMPIPDFSWAEVPYDHKGQRTDVLFKDVPRIP